MVLCFASCLLSETPDGVENLLKSSRKCYIVNKHIITRHNHNTNDRGKYYSCCWHSFRINHPQRELSMSKLSANTNDEEQQLCVIEQLPSFSLEILISISLLPSTLTLTHTVHLRIHHPTTLLPPTRPPFKLFKNNEKMVISSNCWSSSGKFLHFKS